MPIRETSLLAKPVTWAGLAGTCVTLDYLIGPVVQFPIIFVLPVMLAASQDRSTWAYAFAVLLPLIRLSFFFVWEDSPWSLEIAMVNCCIRISALSLVATLGLRIIRQNLALRDQVRLLEGRLPICMICKNIQTADAKWLPLESYVAQHSGVVFSHRRCPACQPATTDSATPR